MERGLFKYQHCEFQYSIWKLIWIVFFSYTSFSNGKPGRKTGHYIQIHNYEQNFAEWLGLEKYFYTWEVIEPCVVPCPKTLFSSFKWRELTIFRGNCCFLWRQDHFPYFLKAKHLKMSLDSRGKGGRKVQLFSHNNRDFWSGQNCLCR